jgi:hypothetical protein
MQRKIEAVGLIAKDWLDISRTARLVHLRLERDICFSKPPPMCAEKTVEQAPAMGLCCRSDICSNGPL